MALNLMYEQREKYADRLDTIIQEVDKSDNGNKQLHLFSQPERLRIGTEVWVHPTTQTDLVYPFSPDQPNEREELVLAIQGYVLKANLPPISNNAQVVKSPTTAKQSIILTGLGCKTFDECAKAILEIHTRLGSHLPNNTLEPWSSQVDEECLCLELSNRYLTPDRLASVYEAIPFDEKIDPLGLLRGKDGGKRTDDNVVLYYERNTGADNIKYTYASCNPVSIKPGHLVEAQVSFCTVPISKGRFLMLSKLRSICILDSQVFKDLNDIAFEAMRSTPRANKRLKRKVGYATEASSSSGKSCTDDTAKAMKRMHLEEGDGQAEGAKGLPSDSMEE